MIVFARQSKVQTNGASAGSEDPNGLPLINQDPALVVSVFLVAGSAILFAYWFRYTCLLLLTAKTPRDYARQVAASNRLSVLEIRSCLAEETPVELGLLSQALDRDYALLLHLLKYASPRAVGESAVERNMLDVYYRLLRVWYFAMRPVSDELARSALWQMSCIVADFANTFGARSAEI